MRAVARQQYDAVSVPPFTLYFHPTDALPYLNYAIPDETPGDAASLAEPLVRLRAEFASRGRRPRFEFVEAVFPGLGPALEASGFEIEARPQIMVCRPEDLRAVPPVAGLSIETLSATSPLDDFRGFLDLQRRAFGLPDAGAVSEADARWLRDGLGAGLCFVGRIGGAAVSVAMFLDPHDALTEVVGICTLKAFRRRGLGGALTHAALEAAFGRGVAAVFLSAADARAGHVYEAAGFTPFGKTVFAVARSPLTRAPVDADLAVAPEGARGEPGDEAPASERARVHALREREEPCEADESGRVGFPDQARRDRAALGREAEAKRLWRHEANGVENAGARRPAHGTDLGGGDDVGRSGREHRDGAGVDLLAPRGVVRRKARGVEQGCRREDGCPRRAGPRRERGGGRAEDERDTQRERRAVPLEDERIPDREGDEIHRGVDPEGENRERPQPAARPKERRARREPDDEREHEAERRVQRRSREVRRLARHRDVLHGLRELGERVETCHLVDRVLGADALGNRRPVDGCERKRTR